MSRFKLRESIAIEAARLIVRGKEHEYATARKRAARWLSRRRLEPEDLPSNAEIEAQVYAITGLFADETQPAALNEMREAAFWLMERLEPFGPRVIGCAVDGPVMIGSEITLHLESGEEEQVVGCLRDAGIRGVSVEWPVPAKEGRKETDGGVIRFHHRFPCDVLLPAVESFGAGLELDEMGPAGASLDVSQLRELIRARHAAEPAEEPDESSEPGDEHEYHPDLFAALRMLLERLESVRLNPERHPEGDALYHSLQVFELGRDEHPYDEEFLLACLLHDVGLALDRRAPVPAALEALGGLLTPRTCFLIEHRPAAAEYLRTGRINRSLRRSEHFDDLLLLARCDRAGRVAGAQVDGIDEALDYIAGLSTAWDDV